MANYKSLIGVLLLVPALATAQRGGSAGGTGDPTGFGGGVKAGSKNTADKRDLNEMLNAGIKLSTKDVEELSPLRLLVDKKKDLKLTDEQLGKLKEQDDQLKAKNEGLFKSLDSLRGILRRPPGNMSDEEKARTTLAREELWNVVGKIRENYDGSVAGATGVLTEEQQGKAKDLVAKQKEEGDKMLADKMGRRRG